ncbi:hypothetical protein M5K25_005627 [Dendrobium thyrsiflorum]|uniref:Uncharacterized protein n=1 Tax=Dendrobium thyrsiflorum TaxID=117978 RepID=A0ABD0VJ49_DENTH
MHKISLTESNKGSFNQHSVNTELQRFLNPTGRLLICRFTGSKGVLYPSHGDEVTRRTIGDKL